LENKVVRNVLVTIVWYSEVQPVLHGLRCCGLGVQKDGRHQTASILPKREQVSIDDQQSTMTVYSKYRSFLLRMWQESPQVAWRASLQDATTGERHGFSDLDSLFAFLTKQQDSDPAPRVDPDGGSGVG
jgi:hypothetical protein